MEITSSSNKKNNSKLCMSTLCLFSFFGGGNKSVLIYLFIYFFKQLMSIKEQVLKEKKRIALSLAIDSSRSSLMGSHLNVGTLLLKKINRYHQKEKLLACKKELFCFLFSLYLF
jgi:hypothetical protein